MTFRTACLLCEAPQPAEIEKAWFRHSDRCRPSRERRNQDVFATPRAFKRHQHRSLSRAHVLTPNMYWTAHLETQTLHIWTSILRGSSPVGMSQSPQGSRVWTPAAQVPFPGWTESEMSILLGASRHAGFRCRRSAGLLILPSPVRLEIRRASLPSCRGREPPSLRLEYRTPPPAWLAASRRPTARLR